MAAYGTAAAITSSLMGKKVKALDKFRSAVKGEGKQASARDSHPMGTLRSRIHSAMERGDM